MDTSLFSRLQAQNVAAAHAVGTSLAPKSGAASTLNSVAGAATRASTAQGAATTTGGTTGAESSAAASSATITSSDFLTLLVSELKNQDPTQPTDPNEYITQLAQVNSLEQLISINSGIASLDSAVTPSSTSSSSGTSSGSGTGTGGIVTGSTGGSVPQATASSWGHPARTAAGANLP